MRTGDHETACERDESAHHHRFRIHPRADLSHVAWLRVEVNDQMRRRKHLRQSSTVCSFLARRLRQGSHHPPAPHRSSLAAPIPLIRLTASIQSGRSAAMARSVAS